MTDKPQRVYLGNMFSTREVANRGACLKWMANRVFESNFDNSVSFPASSVRPLSTPSDVCLGYFEEIKKYISSVFVV